MRAFAIGLVACAALAAATARNAAADTYDTTTTFTATPSSTGVGNTVTFTATVTGVEVPTGTVYFWRAPVASHLLVCSAPLQAVNGSTTTATATCATSELTAGTYSILASYGPDDYSILNPSDSPLQSVTVGRTVTHTTSTSVTASPATFTAGTPETFTAAVVSTDGSGVVPTGMVYFDDNGQPLGSKLLDATGVATLSGITGFVDGDNVITASYQGNGLDILASAGTVTLNVPRQTTTSIQTITTVTTDPQVIETGAIVTITAQVVQYGGRTPVKGNDVVTFTANGEPLGAAPLDANGIATITHTGWVAGTYDVEASYAGNSVYLYEHSQGGATLSVVDPASRAATAIMIGGDTTAVYGGTAVVTATLASGTTALGHERVTINLGGSQSCSTTTDGNGVATCTIDLARDPGPYTVTASFAGDTAFKPTTATGSFTVTKAPTTVTISAVPHGATTTLTALLTDGSQPIAGETLTLALGGMACTTPAVTDDTGTATCSVTTPPGSSATATASFAGDTDYLASSTSTTVQLAAPTTLTYTGATSAEYSDRAPLSATLVDASGTPLANQHVTFTLGTQTCSATTDSDGAARCSIVPITQNAGSYSLTVSYDGDANHQAAGATRTFVVLQEETRVVDLTVGNILASGNVTLSGVLLQDSFWPVSGKTLTLTLDTKSCTAVTNSLGFASCTVDATALNGPLTTAASFAGDTSYSGSTATGSALLYAYAPGGGAFVVGDRDDHGSVMHWGAQWWKSNGLSGSGPCQSFKGYAKDVGDISAGHSWSTGPGNSSPPPSGSLPKYMAVIVASSISKSGSRITGNIAHVVIVKTDGNYDANPGHAGTGTVVATVF